MEIIQKEIIQKIRVKFQLTIIEKKIKIKQPNNRKRKTYYHISKTLNDALAQYKYVLFN